MRKAIRSYCTSTRVISGSRYYCQLGAFHGGDHHDSYGYWPVEQRELTAAEEAHLMNEKYEMVPDWRGDPKRDPRLIKDLSSLIVPPPTFRK